MQFLPSTFFVLVIPPSLLSFIFGGQLFYMISSCLCTNVPISLPLATGRTPGSPERENKKTKTKKKSIHRYPEGNLYLPFVMGSWNRRTLGDSLNEVYAYGMGTWQCGTRSGPLLNGESCFFLFLRVFAFAFAVCYILFCCISSPLTLLYCIFLRSFPYYHFFF